MPVMPSFSAFARGPNLVGAASKARDQVLEAQRTAINANLQRQQLAQQAQQALMKHQVDLMQLDASRKASESQAQIAQQNIELKKAYDSQRLSIMDRQLAIEEQSAASEMEQALMEEELKREYGDLVKTKMSAGMDVESAAREAGLQTGWRGFQGLPAAAIPEGVNQGGGGGESDLLSQTDIPGIGTAIKTSKNAYRLIPQSKVPMIVGGRGGSPEFKEVALDQVPAYYSGLTDRLKTNAMNLNAISQARGEQSKPETASQNVREVFTPNGRKYKLVIPNAPVSNNR